MQPQLKEELAAGQAPKPTPTRKAPRITVETKTRIGAKAPIVQSTVLNVSAGGALIFTDTKQIEGTDIKIELGPPIFPVARLVQGCIRHVDDAPDELVTSLYERGKIAKKKRGYLLGVEFIAVEKEDHLTLARFVKLRAREERERRLSGREGDQQMHTARERTVQLPPAAIPAWAYLMGLLTGAYELISGIFNGASDLDVAMHVGAALATFWFVGRVAATVWNQLEGWRATDNLIVATTDGTEESLDEVLADADSALDLPDDDDEVAAGNAPAEAERTKRSELAAIR